MKNKNKSFNAFSISVIAILLVAILGTGVYAYYQTIVTGTASMTALNWEFTVDKKTDTFSKTVADLKPGSAGSFSLELGATNSGVDVDYEVTIKYATSSDTIENLKFYTDEAHTSELALGTKLTGEIAKASSKTVKIYYYWPYGDTSSVEADTRDAGKSVTFDITVNGKQKQSQS